jgi:methionine synthase II (cobalamin-independent)
MLPRRTVIGSFPSRVTEFGLDGAVRWAVSLQLKYGIQVITDGEQRGNIIDYFEQIPGLGKRFGKPAIIGKIKPIEDLDDFTKISDCKRALEYLEGLGVKDAGVKVTVTGPITLGFTYGIGGLGPYSSILDKRLYLDLAYALNPVIEKAVKMGCYIQVDEPGLTGRFLPPRIAGHILDEFFSSIKSRKEITLHVCGSLGNVPNLYDTLLRLQVDVLSLAFSGKKEEENLQIISRGAFEEHGKKLGAGFISNVEVEPVEKALRRLRIISDKVGVENIAYLHPDCGFRETPLDLVEKILMNMREASRDFLKRDC